MMLRLRRNVSLSSPFFSSSSSSFVVVVVGWRTIALHDMTWGVDDDDDVVMM